ncbi:protein of unknown function [Ruminococcaceae bacterium BL-6]|nr:protein of unknown function [Ruminococcaceae bacterium BL-6]
MRERAWGRLTSRESFRQAPEDADFAGIPAFWGIIFKTFSDGGKNGKKRTEIRTGSALSFLIVLWYGKGRREKEGPG